MKHIILSLSLLLLLGCKKDSKTEVNLPVKDYVTVFGIIKNKISDSISIYQSNSYQKYIAINSKGEFKDTIKVKEPAVFGFYDGKNGSFLFLENDKDLELNYNAESFDKTATFSGDNAKNSQFLLDKFIIEEDLFNYFTLSDLSKEELNIELKKISKELTNFYSKDQSIDSILVNHSNKSLKSTIKSYRTFIEEKINLKHELPKGRPSPTFENYENSNGTTTSLKDFKGKYVYINFWASWCMPCENEYKPLKELIKTYKDRNIEFVSISIDDGHSYNNSIVEAKKAWLNKINEFDLKNTQLIIPKGKATQFIRDYRITGIPIYILIDPDGNIVTPYAPNPSNKALPKLLKTLDL